MDLPGIKRRRTRVIRIVLSPEERLKGLSPDDVLSAMSPEELRRTYDALQCRLGQHGSSHEQN